MASSNLGDVSPNIMGPRCEKTGQACDLHTSTCPVKWDQCVSPGPGVDMFDSTRIIATRIFTTAWVNILRPYTNIPEEIKTRLATRGTRKISA